MGDTKQSQRKVARSSNALFRKTWAGIRAVFSFLGWLISFVVYLNIFPYIWYFLCRVFGRRQLRKRTYGYDEYVKYYGSTLQTLGYIIRSEQGNRRYILKWVQELIPDKKIVDLNRSWSTGISLCALIEAVVPDSCPRHDLLNPDNRVNNCRLGMKLVQRCLGIQQPMEPEEMSEVYRIQDEVMKRYLLSIKYASQTPIEVPELQVKIADAGGKIMLEDKAECTANGSGLVLAVVGKRARFNVTTQTYKVKHLFVDISGPSGERIRKKLVDSSVLLKSSTGTLARQSSKDETVENTDLVSFDYQCVKTGSYQVNYVPRVVGIYEIAISWGAEPIINSPYTIRASLPKGAELPPPYKSSYSDPSVIPEETAEGSAAEAAHPGMLGNRGRRQSLVRQSHVTKRTDSSESSGTLSTMSSLNSSLATSASVDKGGNDGSDVPGRASGPPPTVHRQMSSINAASIRSSSLLTRSSSVMYGTVDGPSRTRTKRKILRRIIKGAGGKEELIHYPQEQRQKTPGLKRGNSISNYSEKSSSTVSSPSRPVTPPPKLAEKPTKKLINTSAATKYGDRMSKILIGKAMYEVSKRELLKNATTRNSKSNSVDKNKNTIPQKKAQEKPKLEPVSNPATNISTPVVAKKTLREPLTKSGSKPLAELQQATQEFTPQMSRDSESSNSNSEREGPLGQESSEQTKGKHKPVKRTSSAPINNNGPKGTSSQINNVRLGTVDRNGPDGQEKGDGEEASTRSSYDKIISQTGPQNTNAKDSTVTNNNKNTKNITSVYEESKENVAPTTIDMDKSSRKKLLQDDSLKENQTNVPSQTSPANVKPTKGSNKGYQSETFKVKRLPANRPRAEKQTQCSAQGIKDETGWISRRTIFQNKQKQKDKDNDSALGESRGSSMLVSNTDSRDVDIANWKSVERENKSPKVREEDGLASEKEYSIVDTTIPFRPRIPSDSAYIVRQRSRSTTMARQATFDSGFSDEQSHIFGSQRSSRAVSRDHSNWQSRTPSASSAASAICFTPELRKTAFTNDSSRKAEHTHVKEDKHLPPSRSATAVVEPQNLSENVQSQNVPINAKDSPMIAPLTEPPRVDISILPNVVHADVPLPAISPENQGSLTVGLALISSTSPTPGNSPLPSPGQLSTPIHSKSSSPTGNDKLSLYSSLDTSASGIAGMSVRDIGEKLASGDMSLDSLLQSLEHDPDYSTREFIRKYRPVIQDNTLDTLQESHCFPDLLEPNNCEGSILSHPESLKSTNSAQPFAEKCHASGVGLLQGLVNTKNNFQVQTDNAGDGSLSVSIRGPQPRTVVESNVVYTGDDLYEVIYEVNLAGFYVINVKWGDRHIPDSPFIVKVSFS